MATVDVSNVNGFASLSWEPLPSLSGSITFIYARDFEESCSFYGEVLGLEVAGSIGEGVRIFALPGAYLGVVKQGVSAAANPPRCAAEAGDTVIIGILCESASDVDAHHARLLTARLGRVETKPVRNESFGLYNMLSRDPNGYLVEVQAFLKPIALKPLRAKPLAMPSLSGSINFIYARDFEGSCAFYGEVLGLEVAGSLGDGVRIFALPGAYLGIVKQGVSAAANPPRCAADAGDTVIIGLLCKSAADVDAHHVRLLAARVGQVEQKPMRNETFGLYNMLARDPNGYLVEVQAFLKPGLLTPLRAKL